MIFTPVIEAWGEDLPTAARNLASDLGLPIKNIYRWRDQDSIPAGWFVPLIGAARRRGIKGVTASRLAELAERRRLERRGSA